jgi:hypothetical protein
MAALKCLLKCLCISLTSGICAPTFAQLVSLPKEELESAVVDGISFRQSQLNNIMIKSFTKTSIHAINDGKIGHEIQVAEGNQSTTWKLGDSYKLQNDRFNNAETKPMWRVTANYESDQGVAKSLSEVGKVDLSNAVISAADENIVYLNKVAYQLGGSVTHSFPDYIPTFSQHILDHRKDMAVKVEKVENAELVVVTLPDVYGAPSTPPRGTRSLWLDPSKGWMIVRMQSGRGEEGATNGYWMRDELNVLESKRFGNVWFPTRISESVRASNAETPGTASVWETDVQDVSVGNVTKKDLLISFPPGTFVHDRIQMLDYRIPLASGQLDAMETAIHTHSGGASATAPESISQQGNTLTPAAEGNHNALAIGLTPAAEWKAGMLLAVLGVLGMFIGFKRKRRPKQQV